MTILKSLNKVGNLFHSKKSLKVVMVGLDYSGKTTILYKLKLGCIIETIPTIGINIETIEMKNDSFTIYDVCGVDSTKLLWKKYMKTSNAIIFVLDSSDRERLADVAIELKIILDEPNLANTPLLIMANKQDEPNSLSIAELTQQLNLHSICKNRAWHIQKTVAMTGEGLDKSFDWLSRTPHRVLQRKSTFSLEKKYVLNKTIK
ncbi:hypothetical protein PPL_00172 [Heterostelium album PN500]|uniref:ADP-ribosylation factor n=1 Tax=Heterostelium pallidum (strain ATCC 26659 / Pp 5 / PN500) TaxID=670386 RepID=D3AVQ7_HETP5|nr:hypothetical protein PPL_00172 [Heterostelium album PN500]EFA86380.1 hypothetical protein PPL_00172 [Heterostelium album PN500]|eukprot:XP_020438485.1 hypothetical protein PPL_00172 [Heterostelium album PN500]